MEKKYLVESRANGDFYVPELKAVIVTGTFPMNTIPIFPFKGYLYKGEWEVYIILSDPKFAPNYVHFSFVKVVSLEISFAGAAIGDVSYGIGKTTDKNFLDEESLTIRRYIDTNSGNTCDEVSVYTDGKLTYQRDYGSQTADIYKYIRDYHEYLDSLSERMRMDDILRKELNEVIEKINRMQLNEKEMTFLKSNLK